MLVVTKITVSFNINFGRLDISVSQFFKILQTGRSDAPKEDCSQRRFPLPPSFLFLFLTLFLTLFPFSLLSSDLAQSFLFCLRFSEIVNNAIVGAEVSQ